MFNCTGKRRSKNQQQKTSSAKPDKGTSVVQVATPNAPVQRDVNELEPKTEDVNTTLDAEVTAPKESDPLANLDMRTGPTTLDGFPSFEAFLQDQANTIIGEAGGMIEPKVEMPEAASPLNTMSQINYPEAAQFNVPQIASPVAYHQQHESKEDLHGQGVEGYLNWGKHIWDWDPNLPSIASETNKVAENTLAAVGENPIMPNWDYAQKHDYPSMIAEAPQFNFSDMQQPQPMLPTDLGNIGTLDLAEAENIPGGLQKPPALLIPELSSGAKGGNLFRSIGDANLGQPRLGGYPMGFDM